MKKNIDNSILSGKAQSIREEGLVVRGDASVEQQQEAVEQETADLNQNSAETVEVGACSPEPTTAESDEPDTQQQGRLLAIDPRLPTPKGKCIDDQDIHCH